MPLLPRHAAVLTAVLTAALLVLAATSPPAVADVTGVPGPSDPPPDLAATDAAEHAALDRLEGAAAWPHRALVALRLERYACAPSRARLVALLGDPAWQVRAFAARALARRREPADPTWFDAETHPRVVRTALRHGLPVDPERVARGVRTLVRGGTLDERLLGAELGAASGQDELRVLATETARTVILRMGRTEGGTLSPRLARLTRGPDARSAQRWRSWLLKTGRSFRTVPALALAPGGPRPAPGAVARLAPERFAALADYLGVLRGRRVDLAICLDCTASMSGELEAAQAGIDDLMLFTGDVVAELRVGLVAYRDRRDRDFEAAGWPFTADIAEARRRLWRLSAQGGGDHRELVHRALETAYGRLDWNRDHVRTVVLIGDAPPHVGLGAHCVEMAGRAARAGIVTHAIEAEGTPVEHFAEIAEAGGGRCVPLEDDDALMAEIAGLLVGDAFRDECRSFFETYLDLCR